MNTMETMPQQSSIKRGTTSYGASTKGVFEGWAPFTVSSAEA